MAETAISLTTVRGPRDDESLALASQLTVVSFTAADATNGFKIQCRKRIAVFVQNTDASAQTITFTSQKDQSGRLGNITNFSLAASAIAVRVFDPPGWANGDWYLVGTVSNAAVKIFAFELP